VTETRLRPKVVLWWGVGLTVAGMVLTTVMPQIGYAASTQFNSATGVDQGLVVLLELVVRLVDQVVPPLGVALIAASVVMAYMGRLLGSRAPVLERSVDDQ
jgi:hypothetical protein